MLTDPSPPKKCSGPKSQVIFLMSEHWILDPLLIHLPFT